MYEYNFETAGLNFKLKTPAEIMLPQSMEPFFKSGAAKKADGSIGIKLQDPLPKMGDCGTWHGPEYYEYSEEKIRIFHSQSAKGDPFSVTEIDQHGNVEIFVKHQYADFFKGGFGIFNRIGIENLLLCYRGLMLHSSFIKYKGIGILFCGPSGVGKSTQADLWKKTLGAEIINGDRTILRKENDTWTAYGSFFSGTSGIALNDCAPLKAIVMLSKAKENQIKPLTPSEAMLRLYPEVSVNRAMEKIAAKTAELCMELISDTSLFKLDCTPDKDAVTALKEGLNL